MVVTCLSKPTERTTRRVNPNVNYGSGVETCIRVGSLTGTNVPLWVVGDADNGEGCAPAGRVYVGILCTSFSVSLWT